MLSLIPRSIAFRNTKANTAWPTVCSRLKSSLGLIITSNVSMRRLSIHFVDVSRGGPGRRKQSGSSQRHLHWGWDEGSVRDTRALPRQNLCIAILTGLIVPGKWFYSMQHWDILGKALCINVMDGCPRTFDHVVHADGVVPDVSLPGAHIYCFFSRSWQPHVESPDTLLFWQ